MPATTSEAFDIARIICKYIRQDRATELVQELVDKVGLRSDNDSLRATLKMLLSILQSASLDVNGRHTVHSINGKQGLRTYEDEALGR